MVDSMVDPESTRFDLVYMADAASAGSMDTVDSEMADGEVDSVVKEVAREIMANTRPLLTVELLRLANGEKLFSIFVTFTCTYCICEQNVMSSSSTFMLSASLSMTYA